MRSPRAVAVACLLVALLAALPAHGQGYPTGKLTGRVMSEGQPLAGVAVTVTSPNLQGERSTTTSTAGEYLFPSLPPGSYSVTFEMQGMETIHREIMLSAAQTATLEAEMRLVAVTEEITVTGTYETISETPQAATTYTKQLVDELPAGRTVNQIVALSPGVLPNGPSKNNETGLGNLTISGAPTTENLFLLNGVVLNENIRGQAFDLFIEDAIEQTTTATGAISSEYGRFSGGVVNVVTKSGGNDFSGSFRTSFTNQKWEEKTSLTTTQTDDIIPTYEATLGGPILRDRIWFFGAGRDRELSETRFTQSFPRENPPINPIAYERLVDQQRYEGKLTATITPRHTLLGTYSKVDETEAGNTFGAILDRDSIVTRDLPQELFSVNYTGVITDNLLLTAQYSEREFSFVNSGARSRDLLTGTLLLDRARGSARYHSPTFCGVCTPEGRDNENLLLKGSYFLSTDSLGSHDIVGGYDSFTDIRSANNHQSGSDWRVIGTTSIIRSDDIFPVFNNDGSTTIQFNPIFQETRGTAFETISYYVNDTWRLSNRVILNLGLRYDANDGEDASGKKVADDSNVSPRLAATFDPRGNGALQVHASYGQYVAALANSIADSSSAGGVPAAFLWTYRGPAINVGNPADPLSSEEALDILFGWLGTANNGLPTTDNPLGGGLVPLAGASIPAVNIQIRDSLDSPNVQEYTLGVTRRLGNRGVLRADYVHRDWSDFYAQRTDRSTGIVEGRVGSVLQRFDLTLVENNDAIYERQYDGLHTAFRFRPLDRLDLGGSWTLSKTEGNLEGENQGSGPVPGALGNYPEYFDPAWNSPSGYLNIDQRHRATVYGVYRLISGERHSLTAGLVQSYFSGRAYSAIGTIQTRPFVTNPGYLTPPTRVNYYFSDRGEYRTPSVTRTDVSVNYDIGVGPLDFFVKGDMLNVFDEEEVDTTDIRYFNTAGLTADNGAACPASPTGRCLAFNPFTETPVEGVHYVKGPDFGNAVNALGFQQPRTYRFAVGVRF